MSALLDTQQIADMLSLSRSYVTDRLTKRPDFPEPFLILSRKTRKWKESDVRAWIDRQNAKLRQPA